MELFAYQRAKLVLFVGDGLVYIRIIFLKVMYLAMELCSDKDIYIYTNIVLWGNTVLNWVKGIYRKTRKEGVILIERCHGRYA